MNQQYEGLPPPPPRSPMANAPNGASPGQRRPVSMVQPPLITTNITRTLAPQSQTPLSATTLAPAGVHHFSPVTPSALNPTSAATPRTSPMEPYNPRQWSNRGPVSGSQMVFQRSSGATNTRDATGMEGAMPSPPPPYSPETPPSGSQGVRPSPMLESRGFVASPLAQSPQVPMPSTFPPPPGQTSRSRERSASGQRSLFNLAGLRGKQSSTTNLQNRNTVYEPETFEPMPPAARRAASTGHLQSSSGAFLTAARGSNASGRSSPEHSWQPGMPLPGPPPGPPPPGLRSQSLNRCPPSSRSNSLTSEHSIEAPPSRRLAARGNNLGPVPPTPADWVDSDAANYQPDATLPQLNTTFEDNYQPLRIDTGSSQDTPLTRRPAKRDGSAQGIRERRSRSRANDRNGTVMSPMSDDSRQADIVFPTTEGSISRRRELMRAASGKPESSEETSSPARTNPVAQAPVHSIGSVLTPPYTPAIGKPSEDGAKKQPLKAPGSASSDRPLSHLLHHPVEDSGKISAPLSPSRPTSSSSAKTPAKLDAFCMQAIERHRSFIEKEAVASTDTERLQLFANFIIHESRLRRDRYSTAYDTMAGDLNDMTRDLWRSYARQVKRAGTPNTSMSSSDPTIPSWASDGQPNSAHGNVPSSASSFGEFTPGTDVASNYDMMDSVGMERSDSRQWGETFKPSLSPIPSMNVSTVPEEEGSSRGRTASRWWEQSNSGSGSIGKPDRIQKTHRETKYMGINPATLQETDQHSPQSNGPTGSTPGPSTDTFGSGPNEYPREKTGWHEGADYETPIATPHYCCKSSTPDAGVLDVSRLVTLPPPYPRHYPALNNKHPELADLRSEYRALADRSSIQQIKDAYLDSDFTTQREQQAAAKERRRKLHSSIQEKIADGSISFADAANAEADFDAEEAERGKANARSNFDVFEASVAHPLNSLINERLEKANVCISQLQAELASRNEVSDPNQTQEEGDEQPERLEKLTLLKWLFEVREQLHKEMFDFHADRSAKYAEVILTPYRIARMQAKLDEATAFFTKDRQERQVSFARDGVKRYEELQSIIETNVSRGVEDQLSAFWDIAPGLLEVIQQIPSGEEMARLEIRIPEPEFAENPAYRSHPLQYLYSLLSHAQKSAFQFIESQTNLLCLLHEVRTATMKARLRLREKDDAGLQAEMLRAEGVLTGDLKEKVGEVERQWGAALGENLEGCKGRVREWLVGSGGWEEGLEG